MSYLFIPIGGYSFVLIETCSLRQICLLYSLCALEGFQYVTCIGLVRLLVHRRICEWTVVGMFFPVVISVRVLPAANFLVVACCGFGFL